MLFHKKWLYGSHVTMFQIWLMTGLWLNYAVRYFIFIYITENCLWMPGKLDNRLHVSKEDCGDIFSCHIWIKFLSWQWNIHRTTTGYNVKWSLYFYLTPGKLMLSLFLKACMPFIDLLIYSYRVVLIFIKLINMIV